MLGYVAITIASVMWSLNPAVVSRFKVFIRPVTYTAMRAVTALLFLAPMVTLGGIDLRNDSTHALVVIVLSAIIGPGLGDALYTRSIQLIGGSLAVLISYTYIFVAQAVATITIGESLKYTVVIGSTMAFTGIAVAVLKSEDTIKLDLRGLVYAVAAALLWGIATVMIKMALTYADTLSLTFVRLLVIATTFLPVGLAIEGPPPKAHL
ncbi:MAG: DMT family transporter, partial [Sulfolobales archaeon]